MELHSVTVLFWNAAPARAVYAGMRFAIACGVLASSLGGFVYVDADNSGMQNGSEPSVVTSGSGNYSFTALANGPYNVREVVPAGFIATTPTLLTPTVSGGGAVTAQNSVATK